MAFGARFRHAASASGRSAQLAEGPVLSWRVLRRDHARAVPPLLTSRVTQGGETEGTNSGSAILPSSGMRRRFFETLWTHVRVQPLPPSWETSRSAKRCALLCTSSFSGMQGVSGPTTRPPWSTVLLGRLPRARIMPRGPVLDNACCPPGGHLCDGRGTCARPISSTSRADLMHPCPEATTSIWYGGPVWPTWGSWRYATTVGIAGRSALLCSLWPP